MEIIKVAFVGFGPGGRIYNAPILSSVPGFSVHSILTSNPENIEYAKNNFPIAILVKEFEEILENPEVDLVILTTPNYLHAEHATKALMAKKHVIVEKPFTVTVKEAEDLIKLSEKHHRVLSINHNRRWDSDFLTVQKVLNDKKLGKIVEYEAHFDRYRNEVKKGWKEEENISGSGILYDLGSHLIDQALMLFGDPEEVFAHLRKQRKNSKVTDNFELLLLYPDLKVTLKAGMLVRELGPRYNILGEKGSFTKFGTDVQEEALKNGKKPSDLPEWGKEPKQIWGKMETEDESIVIESEPGDYRKFYQNIYNTILGKEKLLVKPEEAKTVIKVIELALQSHEVKRILPFK